MRIILILICCAGLHGSDIFTPFVNEVIALNQILEPDLDEEQLRDRYRTLVKQCRQSIGDQRQPGKIIAALNSVLLTDREVSYLSNIYWRDASLNAAVVHKRCNCLAGSTLYVCIAHSLSLPIHMVLSPGHAFVRWDDGKQHINIETTDGGSRRSDASYLWGENQTVHTILKCCATVKA